MKIEKIYIGGWFQRTMLHLNEVYEFLQDGTSQLQLSEGRLAKNREVLGITELSLTVDGFETIKFATHTGINVKILEDGLITISKDAGTKNNIQADLAEVTNYYEKIFSPAISYLFSLGAPVPKELANIKTVFPYFIVLDNAKTSEIETLFTQMDEQKYATYKNENFETYGGGKYFFINVKKEGFVKGLEQYIEETMFFREFKGQLHRYLNLHRIIWEEVESLKEKSNIKRHEITANASRLNDIHKTINLVETRINQMGTYFKTREAIAKSNADFKKFLGIMEYRYETIGNTLTYIKETWTMTKNYVVAAIKLFESLENRVTQKILNNMNIIFGVMLSSTLIGFLWSIKVFPTFSVWGLLYSAMILVCGFSAIKFIQFISTRGKLKISDKDYEKFK